MQRTSRSIAAITTLVFAAVIATACAKKDDYSADTTGAYDTTSAISASSTAPAMQDTATTAATTSKSNATKSTGKTAPKKTSY